jgi:hypothetical protein
MLARLLLSALLVASAGCATVSNDTSETPITAQGIDKEQIRRTIRDHIVPIRHCYEKELKRKPSLAGKLVMEWDIGDLGKVTRVASRKPFDPGVDECVAGVIKGILFETPPKGTTGNVIFPFEFSPNPEKAIK